VQNSNAVTQCSQTLIQYLPTQQHPSLAPMTVRKQAFPVIWYLDFLHPSTYCHNFSEQTAAPFWGWLYITSVVFWQHNTLSVITPSSPTESSHKDYVNLSIFSFRAICSEGSKLRTSNSYKKYWSRSMIRIKITSDSSFI